jgi:hypothetical protein
MLGTQKKLLVDFIPLDLKQAKTMHFPTTLWVSLVIIVMELLAFTYLKDTNNSLFPMTCLMALES